MQQVILQRRRQNIASFVEYRSMEKYLETLKPKDMALYEVGPAAIHAVNRQKLFESEHYER